MEGNEIIQIVNKLFELKDYMEWYRNEMVDDSERGQVGIFIHSIDLVIVDYKVQYFDEVVMPVIITRKP